jgi:hypothetical protein
LMTRSSMDTLQAVGTCASCQVSGQVSIAVWQRTYSIALAHSLAAPPNALELSPQQHLAPPPRSRVGDGGAHLPPHSRSTFHMTSMLRSVSCFSWS